MSSGPMRCLVYTDISKWPFNAWFFYFCMANGRLRPMMNVGFPKRKLHPIIPALVNILKATQQGTTRANCVLDEVNIGAIW